MDIQYSPYDCFYSSKLVQEIFIHEGDQQYLEKLVMSSLDDPVTYPILLTFLDGLHKSYYIYIHEKLVKKIQHEISIAPPCFPRYSFILSDTIKAIIDNPHVDFQFKCKFIVQMFNICLKQQVNAGYFYTSFLHLLYNNRKTTTIPILAVQLLFQHVNFKFYGKYSITNFLYNDWFFQFLTDDELQRCMPILLKKKGLKKWINVINVGSYMFLLSKLAEFLPYDFIQKRLLPACTDKFNDGLIDVLLKIKCLRETDRAWLQSLALLKKLA